MNRSAKSSCQRLRGAAAVELALTMAPLLILTFGVTEYGRAIFTYNTIDKAARDAARYLTAPPPGTLDPLGEAQKLVVYGNVNGTGSPLAPDLTTTMVSICNATLCPATHKNVPTGNGVVNLVTVSISGYTYHSMLTHVAPDTIPFNGISVTLRTNL